MKIEEKFACENRPLNYEDRTSSTREDSPACDWGRRKFFSSSSFLTTSIPLLPLPYFSHNHLHTSPLNKRKTKSCRKFSIEQFLFQIFFYIVDITGNTAKTSIFRGFQPPIKSSPRGGDGIFYVLLLTIYWTHFINFFFYTPKFQVWCLCCLY